ncbi:MAG: glycoside hydrolase family 3 C-terminal domain-containing protein [Bacteriovoracia bacterium]
MRKNAVTLLPWLLGTAFLLGPFGGAKAESTLPIYKDRSAGTEARIDDLISRLTLDEKLDLLGGTGFGSKENKRLGIPSILMIDGPQGIRGPRATAFPSSITMVSTWNPELMRKVSRGIGREVRAYGKNMILGPCVTLYRVPQSGRNYECFGEDPYLNSRFSSAYVKGTADVKVLSSTKHFLLNNQEINRNWVDMHADERSIHELELPAFEAAVKAGTESIMSSYNLVDGVHAAENKELLTGLIKEGLGFKGFIVSDWESTYDGVKSANAGLDLEMPYGLHMGAPIKEAVEKGAVPISLVNDKIRRMMRALYKIGAMDEKPVANKTDLNSKENQQVALEGAREAIVLLKNEKSALPVRPAEIKTIAVIGPNADTIRHHAGGSGQVSPYKNVSVLDGIKKQFGPNVKVVYAQGVKVPDHWELINEKLVSSRNAKGQTVGGFQVEYFDNEELKGKPIIKRTEPDIQIWNTATPDPKLQMGKYSARWTGRLRVEKAGPVTFDMGVTWRAYRVIVDGKVVQDYFDLRGDGGDNRVKIEHLDAGLHDIKIEYRNEADNFKFSLAWAQPEADIAEAVALAKKADAAVVVVGTSNDSEGESIDRKSLYLPGDQDQLILEVAKANPRTTVIVNTGGPVLMDKWKDKVPAILQAWFPGQEGGTALAEIVSGKVNPSGKLPVTLPKKLEDSPSATYYHGQSDKIDYGKVGVLEGYRGYDAKNIEPEFAFGHGLSYTTFQYSDLKVDAVSDNQKDPKVKVTMKLTNSGKVAGAEAVQLYVGEQSPEVERAPKELKGFEKISLRPGESRMVSFTLDAEAFRYWNDKTHAWTIKPGNFSILVGSSSRDIRLKSAVTIKPPQAGTKSAELGSCKEELRALLKQKEKVTQRLRDFSDASWFAEIRSKLHLESDSLDPAAPQSLAACKTQLAQAADALANMQNVTKEFAKKFDSRLYKVNAEAGAGQSQSAN